MSREGSESGVLEEEGKVKVIDRRQVRLRWKSAQATTSTTIMWHS